MQTTYFAIFLEGLLSFLSPCVLPLLPLYMSYLAGENKTIDENGKVHYQFLKVFLTTLFFVLGICLTFLLLSLSLGVISDFLTKYSITISIIGGTLLIFFGLHEIGILHISILDKELKVKSNLHLEKMSYPKAFLFGFLFSVGWSPCIGPMLSNALLMAATNSNGYLYLLFYGLGFIIPFLITGCFTSFVLNFFEKNKKIISWVSKIAGVILICFGCYMIYNATKEIETATTDSSSETSVMDVTFYDMDGKEIKLSDYKGKYVFLNFTASWCTYCQQEMPEYEQFAKENDVVCLYVMSPLNETNDTAIDEFIEEYNPTLRIINDTKGTLFYLCNINSFPQTYVIAPNNEFITYVQGAMSLSGFEGLYDYAKQLYESK